MEPGSNSSEVRYIHLRGDGFIHIGKEQIDRVSNRQAGAIVLC